MSTGQLLLWWGLLFGGVIACGIFAGLETGMYSLNRVRLHLLADRGQPSARILQRLIHRPNRLLSTLLIGTNIATNITTSAVGVLLHSLELEQWQVIIADVLIVTPLLFVFAETLPKDLFAAHADRLVYPFARLIQVLLKLFTWLGVIPLITLVSQLAMRAMKMKATAPTFHPRAQVEALVKEGVGHGLLSDDQSAIIERVLNLSKLRLKDEMVPWKKVVTIGSSESSAAMWKLAKETSLSRFPVLDDTSHVVGVIDLYHVLTEYTEDDCPSVKDVMEPPRLMSAGTSLREAMILMRQSERHDAITIVMKDEMPVGVVTIKDLVEPITGELYSW